MTAVQRSNNDVGGSVVEMSEREYMVRSRAYLRGLGDLACVPVGMGKDGTALTLGDIATLQIAGEVSFHFRWRPVNITPLTRKVRDVLDAPRRS